MQEQLLALSAKELLGLTVVGSLITVSGTLIALVLKERVFARSFERWRERRALESLYTKYRDPIVLAAYELSIRLKEVCERYGLDYLRSSVLDGDPERQGANWSQDPYYLRYKFDSTIFRLCSLLGWFEIYRQDVVFLRSGRARHTRRLEEAIAAVREALADGQLNDASDWFEWRDHLIFREEQRAVGEVMITSANGARAVMGYREFFNILRSRPPSCAKWLDAVTLFFLDIGEADRDFRLIRAKALYVRLIDLVELLDNERMNPSVRERRLRYRSELPSFARTKLTSTEKTRRIERMLGSSQQS